MAYRGKKVAQGQINIFYKNTSVNCHNKNSISKYYYKAIFKDIKV